LGALIGDTDWKYENQFGAGNKAGEGTLGKEETNENITYTQREGERGEQEPGTYRANTNRANRGGILTSGINATRVNNIAQHFANQRFNTTKAHTEAAQRFGTARTEGQHNYEGNVNKALAEARFQAWKEN